MARLPGRGAPMPRIDIAQMAEDVGKVMVAVGEAAAGLWCGEEEAPVPTRPPAPINGQPVTEYVAPGHWPAEWGPKPAELDPPDERSEPDERARPPILVPHPPGGTIPGAAAPAPPQAEPEEHTGTPQAEPPLTGGNPISTVNAKTEERLRQRANEDDECQECERCKILHDGGFSLKSYGANKLMGWAMRYQHHVIPWHLHLPDQHQIMEFDIADPGAARGVRAMDGFAIAPCFLIEAKLGYSKYLRGGFGDQAVVPKKGQQARLAMQKINHQLSAHSAIAGRYTRYRQSDYDHTVIWVVSNMLMQIYVGGYIREADINDRLSVFTIKAPPSIFSGEEAEANIPANETEEY